MTSIEQPDTNHSTKNYVDFRENSSSHLGAFSIIRQHWSTLGFGLRRPLTPLLPTPLRCDSIPSGKACCSNTIYGKSGLFCEDNSRVFEQVKRNQHSEQPPQTVSSELRLNACTSLFDTLVWLNMTINHYNEVYRS